MPKMLANKGLAPAHGSERGEWVYPFDHLFMSICCTIATYIVWSFARSGGGGGVRRGMHPRGRGCVSWKTYANTSRVCMQPSDL